jgi:NAD(P)H-dependent flavin oxidoreductase YrpB (nitropropane dioxygenase family)
MLAGVDYVLMGAGIPKDIPGALDRMADHEPAVTRFEVQGPMRNGRAVLKFDPRRLWEEKATPLKRPKFLPIVSSHTLASMLARKGSGRVDGFVVEGPTAGGHNAPPRGEVRHTDRGEPVYGERDEANLEKVADLGLPFWVAGGTGHPQSLLEVQKAGGEGIQVGTLFAFCEESALKDEFKRSVLDLVSAGQIDVLTDPRCSPTGFPFKIVQLPDSLSSEETYRLRERVCDLGYLRTPYVMESGRVGFRCPAEPVKTFVKKGGTVDEAEGRKCLCNALLANVNIGQLRPGGELELPLITSGDHLTALGEFLDGRSSYSAADVIEYLLS